MRRAAWILAIGLAVTAFAAANLSRDEARRRISEFAASKLVPDAIEIRRITAQGDDTAIAETTITLAFQFKKAASGDWAVDAVRLGDRDWVNMTELLTAIHHGNPPPVTVSSPPATPRLSRTETLHANPTEFEKTRRRMQELGLSPLVPGEIEIRRVSSQSDVRTIAEATVTMGFEFKRNGKAGRWAIEAARLGNGSWVNTNDVIATLNDGRRRATLAMMQKLIAGVERYRLEDGTLPPAKDILELTNVLHPHYMIDLIREDGWGQPLEYNGSGFTFRLVSRGADGVLGTPDDIVAP